MQQRHPLKITMQSNRTIEKQNTDSIYINKTDAQQKIRKFILKCMRNFQKRNRRSLLFGRTTSLQAISASEKQHFYPRKITMNAIKYMKTLLKNF